MGRSTQAMDDWRYAADLDDAPKWVVEEAHTLRRENQTP
jgi:hypothetical protein